VRLTGSLGPRLLRLSWTWWKSKPRKRYHGTLMNWTCRHAHRSPEAAQICASRHAMHRGYR
jgi:hypothetical protein